MWHQGRDVRGVIAAVLVAACVGQIALVFGGVLSEYALVLAVLLALLATTVGMMKKELLTQPMRVNMLLGALCIYCVALASLEMVF